MVSVEKKLEEFKTAVAASESVKDLDSSMDLLGYGADEGMEKLALTDFKRFVADSENLADINGAYDLFMHKRMVAGKLGLQKFLAR